MRSWHHPHQRSLPAPAPQAGLREQRVGCRHVSGTPGQWIALDHRPSGDRRGEQRVGLPSMTPGEPAGRQRHVEDELPERAAVPPQGPRPGRRELDRGAERVGEHDPQLRRLPFERAADAGQPAGSTVRDPQHGVDPGEPDEQRGHAAARENQHDAVGETIGQGGHRGDRQHRVADPVRRPDHHRAVGAGLRGSDSGRRLDDPLESHRGNLSWQRYRFIPCSASIA